MKTTGKLHPGQVFAALTFRQLNGAPYDFGAPGSWQALFVIRGQHCPICRSYLGEIEKRRVAFAALGVTVAAVSADSAEQTRQLAEMVNVGFQLLHGLDEPTMRTLGLYVSTPRSPQETDHRFPEPALFIVNAQGLLQIVDVANAPFVRPDLDRLLAGLRFAMEKNYPVRGTAT